MKNKYEIHGDITVVFVKYKGEIFEALIDTEDLGKLEKFPNTWSTTKNRYVISTFPKNENGKRGTVRLHRYLIDVPDTMVVDHINHNPLDNRKQNLRIVTVGQNNQNTLGARKDNRSSGERNINWNNQHKKWHVKLNIEGESKHIGFFENLDEAKEIVKKARAILMPFSYESLTESVTETDQRTIDELLNGHKLLSTNKSGVQHIYFDKRLNKWCVAVNRVHLGVFKEFIDAVSTLERALSEGVETVKLELSKKVEKDNTISGIKHVIWNNGSKKWQVVIVKNKKRHYFGSYDTKKEAAEVAKKAKEQLAG